MNLMEHEKFIHQLITNWKVPEQDREDAYQDFFVYYTKYATYDPKKGSPTTFINKVFKNFMLSKRRVPQKNTPVEKELHIESRDKGFLDRILGAYEAQMDEELLIEDLLKDIDPVTLSIIIGNTTITEQAKEEGVSTQAVQQRHERKLKKLRGE